MQDKQIKIECKHNNIESNMVAAYCKDCHILLPPEKKQETKKCNCGYEKGNGHSMVCPLYDVEKADWEKIPQKESGEESWKERLRKSAKLIYFGKDDNNSPNYMSDIEIDWWIVQIKDLLQSEREKYMKENCEYPQIVKKELVEKIQKELMNGELRDSFEKYFEKDNIDVDGNYLDRRSTTNRSGALAYLGDVNSYLRKLLQENKE